MALMATVTSLVPFLRFYNLQPTVPHAHACVRAILEPQCTLWTCSEWDDKDHWIGQLQTLHQSSPLFGNCFQSPFPSEDFRASSLHIPSHSVGDNFSLRARSSLITHPLSSITFPSQRTQLQSRAELPALPDSCSEHLQGSASHFSRTDCHLLLPKARSHLTSNINRPCCLFW